MEVDDDDSADQEQTRQADGLEPYEAAAAAGGLTELDEGARTAVREPPSSLDGSERLERSLVVGGIDYQITQPAPTGASPRHATVALQPEPEP